MVLKIHDEDDGDVFASSLSRGLQVTLRYDAERRVVVASGYYESVEVPLDELVGDG